MKKNTQNFGTPYQQRDADLDRLIPELIQHEKNIAEYEAIVNSIHPDFWARILRLAPNLTPMELRVCGLTRLHMHAKEAARVLHIAQSSVETHRSNARLKLRIDRGRNFVSMLHAI